MRLATHGAGRVGVIAGGELVDTTDDLKAVLPPVAGISLMRQIITCWAQAQPALAAPSGRHIPLADVSWDPPVPDPSKVIAAPVNYRDHQKEMSQESHVDGLGVFLKAPSSVLGHRGMVHLPYSDRRFDHEAEFALVLGRRARNVTENDALDYVFGYTGLLDLTMRGGEDRSTRKSFDTFTPMGPWLVTADEFGSPANVDFSLTVNNTVRQRASTRDLIWTVPKLIAYASSVMTLLPGDVITTGTPAGVGPITDGDHVALMIDGLARLEVDVTSSGAVLSPTRGANRGPVPPPARPAP